MVVLPLEGERFQILSLDGGGIRGLFSAAVLAAMEEDLGGAAAPMALAGLAPEPEPELSAPVAIDLPEDEGEAPELEAPHAFVPPAAATGHQPQAAVAAGGPEEAALRDALSKASREVLERVIWEVVPQLAETIIRENLDRLVKGRQK